MKGITLTVFGELSEVSVIAILSNGTAYGFTGKESLNKFMEVLDLEDSAVDVTVVVNAQQEEDEDEDDL